MHAARIGNRERRVFVAARIEPFEKRHIGGERALLTRLYREEKRGVIKIKSRHEKKTRRNEEWMKGNERLRSPCVEICWLRSIAAA